MALSKSTLYQTYFKKSFNSLLDPIELHLDHIGKMTKQAFKMLSPCSQGVAFSEERIVFFAPEAIIAVN